jgi:hypothetical protein
LPPRVSGVIVVGDDRAGPVVDDESEVVIDVMFDQFAVPVTVHALLSTRMEVHRRAGAPAETAATEARLTAASIRCLIEDAIPAATLELEEDDIDKRGSSPITRGFVSPAWR